MAAAILRLVVLSPDGRRVLARPTGLAGWALPTVVVVDRATPTEDELSAAAPMLGTTVTPLTRLADDLWLVEASGRVRAVGNHWIAPGESSRLGADASVFAALADRGHGVPDGPSRTT